MRLFALIVLAAIVAGPLSGSAQDVVPDTLDWKRYFPLEVGNQWHYRFDFENGAPLFDTWQLIGDALLDGHAYFILQRCLYGADHRLDRCKMEFVRHDTTHANVVFRITTPEGLPEERWFEGIPCGLDAPFGGWAECTGTDLRNEHFVDGLRDPRPLILGRDTVVAEVEKSFSSLTSGHSLYSDVGLVSFVAEGGPRVELVYLYVGQKSYGEAVLPTARGPEAELPHDLTITSVYPNPFSTDALVAYSVARSAWVIVEVYDALGQRVRVAPSRLQDVGPPPLPTRWCRTQRGYVLRATRRRCDGDGWLFGSTSQMRITMYQMLGMAFSLDRLSSSPDAGAVWSPKTVAADDSTSEHVRVSVPELGS